MHFVPDWVDMGYVEHSKDPPDSIKGRKFFNSAIVRMLTIAASWH
jgi:hypothetical protein